MGEAAVEALRQGVFHIWTGWDHLAFLLCLRLLASGRQLIVLVAAFTIGHSISLALVFYQLANIPSPPVEIVIALSIAVMAREALHATGVIEIPNVLNRHLLTVLLFGLLHGLGLGSAFHGLGASSGGQIWSLTFFNLGIALGEFFFVALLTVKFGGLRTISLAQPVRTAALYLTGAAGVFWTVQRAVVMGIA